MTQLLDHVKKFLGIPEMSPGELDTSYDSELQVYINSAIDELRAIGALGREPVVTVDDLKRNTSNDIGDDLINEFIMLKVKIVFDPPQPRTIDVLSEQIERLKWYIQVFKDKSRKEDAG